MTKSANQNEELSPEYKREILADAYEEAKLLIDSAQRLGLTARLIGGVAFRAQLPDWPLRKAPAHDLDFVVRSADARGFAHLLEAVGYVPDKKQNALFGHKQLYFVDMQNQRPVDVIIDRLEMCHTLELKDRLDMDPMTVARVDLLLSKLQIVKLNRKDALDGAALLSMYELGDDEGINLDVFRSLLGEDWGWWRTVTANLDVILQFAQSNDDAFNRDITMDSPARMDLVEQLSELKRTAHEAPKSRSWKWRSKLGDRVIWYEEPEEVDH